MRAAVCALRPWHCRTRTLTDDLRRDAATRAVTVDSPRIEDLRAEARYHRDRHDLYRAKMYGLRPTTMTRFRELEQIYQGANARLRRAQEEHPPHTRG